MTRKLVLLEKFPNESSAAIARAILNANGIPTIVSGDGAYGVEPQLMFVQGVRVQVYEDQLDEARELLAADPSDVVEAEED
jgi:hypothetical protein